MIEKEKKEMGTLLLSLEEVCDSRKKPRKGFDYLRVPVGGSLGENRRLSSEPGSKNRGPDRYFYGVE